MLRNVGLEAHLLADPVGTLLGDGPLGEIVPQFDLKIGTIERALAIQFWDIELSFLFLCMNY